MNDDFKSPSPSKNLSTIVPSQPYVEARRTQTAVNMFNANAKNKDKQLSKHEFENFAKDLSNGCAHSTFGCFKCYALIELERDRKTKETR